MEGPKKTQLSYVRDWAKPEWMEIRYSVAILFATLTMILVSTAHFVQVKMRNVNSNYKSNVSIQSQRIMHYIPLINFKGCAFILKWMKETKNKQIEHNSVHIINESEWQLSWITELFWMANIPYDIRELSPILPLFMPQQSFFSFIAYKLRFN